MQPAKDRLNCLGDEVEGREPLGQPLPVRVRERVIVSQRQGGSDGGKDGDNQDESERRPQPGAAYLQVASECKAERQNNDDAWYRLNNSPHGAQKDIPAKLHVRHRREYEQASVGMSVSASARGPGCPFAFTAS